MDNVQRISLNAQAAAHVQAYIDYRNIVGDTDGGRLLSEAEYEEAKQRALEARKHRVYVSWRNMKSGLECRLIGPSSMCFCNHRYRDHATDSADKIIHCRMKNCPCKQFDHIPVRGAQDIKCHCKHSFNKHDISHPNRVCTLSSKCKCPGFLSSFGCSCGDDYSQHSTVFETREERLAAGLPVDNLADGGVGIPALGGITNFSSLIDGVDREPGSGAGASSPNASVGPVPPQLAAPPKKLTENEEMALYASKYENPSAPAAAPRPSNWVPRQKQGQGAVGDNTGPEQKRDPLETLKKKHEAVRRHHAPTSAMESRPDDPNESARAAVFLEDCKIAELEQELADTSLSEAKKYAIKKEIAKHKANRLKEQRRGSANMSESSQPSSDPQHE